MLYLTEMVVKEVISSVDEVTEILAEQEGNIRKALNYDDLTGAVKAGDRIVINTVAIDLDLGSGGQDFVYFNHDSKPEKAGKGHIIKQRYTPWQFPVLTAEENESPYHDVFNGDVSLDGMPVAVGTLHSQLPGFCLTLKKLKPSAKLAFVMTDGAALPLKLSRIVRYLTENNYIEKTITYGQAFGGDIETVNVFTALIAAKRIAKADVAIITMGPGITGTDTKLGFTGMEQGQILNAVSALNGKPVAIPRISFADKRERHLGISHHTVTALNIGCNVKADLPLPNMDENKKELVTKQFNESRLNKNFEMTFHETTETLALISKSMPWVTTMGRSINEDPEIFLASGSAACRTVELI